MVCAASIHTDLPCVYCTNIPSDILPSHMHVSYHLHSLKSCKHISDFKLILLPKLPPHLASWDWISAHQTSVLLMYILRLFLTITNTGRSPETPHISTHEWHCVSTKMWSISDSSHYERSKCNYKCVDMVILSSWQLDILMCRLDYSNTIITAIFIPSNTSLKNLLYPGCHQNLFFTVLWDVIEYLL